MLFHEDGVNQIGIKPIQEVPLVEVDSITVVVKDGYFADKGDDHELETAEVFKIVSKKNP